MFLKVIFLYLIYIVVFCQANCFTGSVNCHQAATCQNVSGTPTCVCDPWFTGDGVNQCYGVCNSSCSISTDGMCRATSMGYTCLPKCLHKSSGCPDGPNMPANVRVAWKSSTAIVFHWDFVNAYLFKTELRASHLRRGKHLTTIIPFAGFTGLTPGTTYQFAVSMDALKSKARLTATTDELETRATDLCDNPGGCDASVNECQLGTHRCHIKATCSNTKRGYRCTCKPSYIGNGTFCIGVCDQPCGSHRSCYPVEYGTSCICTSHGRGCSVPQTPNGIRLTLQTETTLGFSWPSTDNAASYSVLLNPKIVSKSDPRIYQTTISQAAFTGLQPGNVYTLQVTAFNVIGASENSPTFSASTVIASGPNIRVRNTKSNELTISFQKVDNAVSYEVEYYQEPSTVLRKTGKATTYTLTDLSTGNFYYIKVFVNYKIGRSKGSSPVKVFVGPLCNNGKEVCQIHEHCNVTRCQCEDGYSKHETTCSKIYAIPFRQSFLPNNTNKMIIESQLGRELNSKQVASFDVGDVTNQTVTFTVYTNNPNFTLNGLNLGDTTVGHPVSIKKTCLTQNISGFTFTETEAGNTQESVQTCKNGEPKAKITCYFNQTLSSNAIVLESRFNKETLNVTDCEGDSAEAMPAVKGVDDFKYNATGGENNNGDVIFDIVVPAEAIKQAIAQLNVSNVVPSITLYQGYQEVEELFPSDYNVSHVVSIDIGEDTVIENLESPVVIINFWENTTHGETKPMTPLTDARVVQRCVYWDEEEKEWSGRGCCLDNYLSPPTCKCNHLSSFAIIVSTVEVPANLALTIVSNIACGLSIVGLAATFLILILNKEARVKVPNQIQLHFCFALFVTYIVFLFGVSEVQNFASCLLITAVLHYFFLVSWIWIGIYSNRLYVALAYVFKQTGNAFVNKCCVFAYGVPLIVVGFNVGITVGYFDDNLRDDGLCYPDDSVMKKSYYKAENMCWLNSYSLYFGFLIIIGIILINNVIVLILVMGKLFQRQNIRSTRAKRSRFSDLISAISLSFTLGLTWLFGFLMLLSTNVTYNQVMMWLFAIFTASQGFAIWYVTCLRRKDMRDFWWLPMKNFFMRIGLKLGCFSTTTKTLKRGGSRIDFMTSSTNYDPNKNVSTAF